MAVIFDAYRVDPITGTMTLHRGTKDYLDNIRAVLIDKSAREVPEHHVDDKGEYRVKDPGASRS